MSYTRHSRSSGMPLLPSVCFRSSTFKTPNLWRWIALRRSRSNSSIVFDEVTDIIIINLHNFRRSGHSLGCSTKPFDPDPPHRPFATADIRRANSFTVATRTEDVIVILVNLMQFFETVAAVMADHTMA